MKKKILATVAALLFLVATADARERELPRERGGPVDRIIRKIVRVIKQLPVQSNEDMLGPPKP